jgi:hypothetical protein
MRSTLSFGWPCTLVTLIVAAGCAAPARPAPITPCPVPPPPAPVAVAPAAAPASSALSACPGGMQATPTGLFDDFEDGTSQVAVLEGRAGYWWVAKAEHATITLPVPEFRTADGGPTGSTRAAHFTGKTDTQDQWGASLGANFLGGGFYDASKYAGVSFKIKGTPKGFVRFKLHDVNTHPDGGICGNQCWNGFGKTLELTGDWQSIELSFAELRQIEGWGAPRPPSVTPSKVKNFEWAVDQGETFDFWVDDVRLLSCK